jgi:hypothetical protein
MASGYRFFKYQRGEATLSPFGNPPIVFVSAASGGVIFDI